MTSADVPSEEDTLKKKKADEAVRSILGGSPPEGKTGAFETPYADNSTPTTNHKLSAEETKQVIEARTEDSVDKAIDRLTFEDKKAWVDAVYFGDGRVTFKIPLISQKDLDSYKVPQTYAVFTAMGPREMSLADALIALWSKTDNKTTYMDISGYMSRATLWLQLTQFSKTKFDDAPEGKDSSDASDVQAWSDYILKTAIPRLSLTQRMEADRACSKFMSRLTACSAANSRGTF